MRDMNESSKTNIVVVKYTLNGATQQNLFWGFVWFLGDTVLVVFLYKFKGKPNLCQRR